MYRNKTIMILSFVAAVLAAAALIQHGLFSSVGMSNDMLGAPLWEDGIAIGQVAAIFLENQDQVCRLTRSNNGWKVENRFGYCADFAKISKLLKKIDRLKTGYAFDADQDVLSRLHLDGPPATKASKGIRIKLQSNTGEIIADLVIGKQRQPAKGSGGQFVRKTAQKKVYLVDEAFRFLKAGPEYWIMDDLVTIAPDQISKVDCFDTKGNLSYSLERPGPGKPAKLTHGPQGGKVSEARLGQLLDALNPLKIADVLGPATAKVQNSSRHLTFYLENGAAYTVYLLPKSKAKTGDLYRLALRKTKDATTAKRSVQGCAASADPGTWLYGVEKWQYQSFITDAKQLLAKQ